MKRTRFSNEIRIGTKIRVNKGQIETLIEKDGSFGVFKSEKYQIVRNILSIMPEEIIR